MAERRRAARPRGQPSAALEVRDLHVYYGQSHALQGVDLSVDSGVHAVVGRNGMGKTTLCNAIVGLTPASRGSVRVDGEEVLGLPPHAVVARGVGYTPQGRRLWASLTVDEHLRLAASGSRAWTIERVYATFPRLYERRGNGGAQLSGGEQQMLAIARALLKNPSVLVLDEPTEGLAPVVVEQVEALLRTLVEEGDVAVLLIEQNIAVALAVAEDVGVMVNGRITRVLPAAELAADRTLQERLLGVGRHSHEDAEAAISVSDAPGHVPAEHSAESSTAVGPTASVSALGGRDPSRRDDARSESDERGNREGTYTPPTRWSAAAWRASDPAQAGADALPSVTRPAPPVPLAAHRPARPQPAQRRNVLVAGTFDTKGEELRFIRERLRTAGLAVRTVDLSTSGKPSAADVAPHEVAAYRAGGPGAVFSGDRGASVRAMSEAFEAWTAANVASIAGLISAGGSGGTALATPAMRALPIGIPKVMVSTVASGNVADYVGPSDIAMMYSVTDVQGLNRISRDVLANGAHALAGMVRDRLDADADARPALGLTMFGVTTPAVQQITALLEDDYDCLVFHATGVGGRSMEKLADSGLLDAALDLTTTEVCDLHMGGVFAATEDRFGAFIRTAIPYVGSVGALDMVNFGARDTVPARYAQRRFVEHNPLVTLMRTTADENTKMGEWIAERLNRMRGPVRFLLPEGGVSALDAPGQPFHDQAADAALFAAIERVFVPAPNRTLVRVPHHVNDAAFAAAAVRALAEVRPAGSRSIAGRAS